MSKRFINKVIIDKNKVIKKRNDDVIELYDYLETRNFDNFPKMISKDERNIEYEYIEEKKYHEVTSGVEFIKTVSILHYKTLFFKDVSKNKYRKIYDKLSNNIDYLKEYYEDYPVVNSGVSGDFTSSIVENMKKRVYDYNPSKVFLLIGINDLRNGKDVSEIVSNTKEIIELIKENRPYSEIYLESIYPINKTDNEKLSGALKDKAVSNDDVKEVNSELVKLSEKLGVTYIDVFSKLVLEDGNLNSKYTDDGLHLNSVGYDTVTEVLSKYVED